MFRCQRIFTKSNTVDFYILRIRVLCPPKRSGSKIFCTILEGCFVPGCVLPQLVLLWCDHHTAIPLRRVLYWAHTTCAVTTLFPKLQRSIKISMVIAAQIAVLKFSLLNLTLILRRYYDFDNKKLFVFLSVIDVVIRNISAVTYLSWIWCWYSGEGNQ